MITEIEPLWIELWKKLSRQIKAWILTIWFCSCGFLTLKILPLSEFNCAKSSGLWLYFCFVCFIIFSLFLPIFFMMIWFYGTYCVYFIIYWLKLLFKGEQNEHDN